MAISIGIFIQVKENYEDLGNFNLDIDIPKRESMIPNADEVEAVKAIVPIALAVAFELARAKLNAKSEAKPEPVVDAEVPA